MNQNEKHKTRPLVLRRRPGMRRRRCVVGALGAGFLGVVVFMGLVISDSGAHTAWAKSADSLDGPDTVRAFVESQPLSTIGDKAFRHAVDAFVETVHVVEGRLIEAERLRSCERFEEVASLIRNHGSGGTPAQQARYEALDAWVAQERRVWEAASREFEEFVELGNYSASFKAYVKLCDRFPYQSQRLSFPACITTVPSGAVVNSEAGSGGLTPHWMSCRANTPISLNHENFFATELPPPRTWSDSFIHTRLKPRPQWLVRGGGRFSLHHGEILLIGADGVVRLLHARDGHVHRRSPAPGAIESLEKVVPFGDYLVTGVEGNLSFYDIDTLEKVRTLRLGKKHLHVQLATVDARRLLAGNAELGILIFRDAICRVESRIPGLGPCSAFVPWRGGYLFRSTDDRIVFWKDYGIRRLGSYPITIFFTLDEHCGGITDAGDVLLWNAEGTLATSFNIGQGGARAPLRAAAADDGRLTIGFRTGEVRMFTLQDGSLLWCRGLGDGSISDVQMAGGHVVVAMEDDWVHLLKAETGEQVMCIPTEGNPRIHCWEETLLVSDQRSLYAYPFP